MNRFVSLCVPSQCNAGEDCVHYFEEDDIGFCLYADTKYDVLYKGSVVLSDLTCDEFSDFIEKINNFLFELIHRWKIKI